MATTKNFRYRTENELIEFAAQIIEQRFVRERRVIFSSSDATNLLRAKLAGLDHEVCAVLFLDGAHAVIAFEKMFRGSLKQTVVFPREIARAALKHNAAAIILAHNHPSGKAEPSSEDWRLTSRVTEALELIDVKVLDHVIVAGTHCTSLSECAGLTFPEPPPKRKKRRKTADARQ